MARRPRQLESYERLVAPRIPSEWWVRYNAFCQCEKPGSFESVDRVEVARQVEEQMERTLDRADRARRARLEGEAQ